MFRSFDVDDLGNRTGVTFLNGASQGFGFDSVSRLDSLTNGLAGTANDLTKTYGYNPASQIVSETRSNEAYAFPKASVNEPGTANGLNQLTQYAGKTIGYDGNGNLSELGLNADTFGYSSENLLTSAKVSGVQSYLQYDPLMRLYQTNSAGTPLARYAYDGLNALAEYDSSGVLQRRWVYDPTTGQPLVWYEGRYADLTAKRYLGADERGSIISVSDSTGASLGINTYDEYGIPAASNVGRYGYTGQAWLGPAKLWYLNARMYSPAIGGTFLQPDPIGYAGGMNLYAYVGGDPVNFIDPLGFSDVLVVGCRIGTISEFIDGAWVCRDASNDYLVNRMFYEPGPRMFWDPTLGDVGGGGGSSAPESEGQCNIVRDALGTIAEELEVASDVSNAVSDLGYIASLAGAPPAPAVGLGADAISVVFDVFSYPFDIAAGNDIRGRLGVSAIKLIPGSAAAKAVSRELRTTETENRISKRSLGVATERKCKLR